MFNDDIFFYSSPLFLTWPFLRAMAVDSSQPARGPWSVTLHPYIYRWAHYSPPFLSSCFENELLPVFIGQELFNLHACPASVLLAIVFIYRQTKYCRNRFTSLCIFFSVRGSTYRNCFTSLSNFFLASFVTRWNRRWINLLPNCSLQKPFRRCDCCCFWQDCGSGSALELKAGSGSELKPKFRSFRDSKCSQGGPWKLTLRGGPKWSPGTGGSVDQLSQIGSPGSGSVLGMRIRKQGNYT